MTEPEQSPSGVAAVQAEVAPLEGLWRRVFEALPAHISVVDREGCVVAVNQAWSEFAAGNEAANLPSISVGANYLEVCRRAAVAGDLEAAETLEGIEAVLSGARPQFTREYPCHSPLELRWFSMVAVPLGPGGGGGAVISHLNITERKLAEEALRESEERLRVATQAAGMFAWECDLATGIMRWSENTSAVIGCRPDDLPGVMSEGLFFVASEERDRLLGEYGDAVARRLITARSEFRGCGPPERSKHFVAHARILYGGDGVPLRVLGVTQDITDRKLAEQALRESEERFRATFENAAVGMALQALDGRWLRVNAKLCEITGYSREELLQKTFAEITHPDDLEADLAESRKLLAGEIPNYGLDKRHLRKDGSIVWISLTVSLMRRPDGEPDYFIKIARDISLRKGAEAELAASQQRFAGIVESAMDAIISIGADQRIVLFNKAAEDMFRCPATEAIGSPIDHFIPERFRVAHRGHVERYGQDGLSNRALSYLPLSALRANGEEFPVEASISRTLAGGERLFTVIIRDVTERVRAHQALETSLKDLREAQEALVRKERLATLGQLAGSVAHELRTPLNVISNSVYFLKEALADSEGEIRECLDEMGRAVGSSDLIISEMLDYVREPAQKTSDFSVGEIIDRALKLLPLPPQIRLAMNGEGHDFRVRANQDQVTRILVNLIQNAIHAMPDGGELGIAVTRRKGDRVCIEVRDTGCGISKENLPKIFEPLFTTKTKGIGLGLAISHRYAKLNGGWLVVDSREGEGTTFQLILNPPE